ncbi:MAG TPA: glycyl radical protein [Candidatus Coprenecus stercorigallinarum]|nr:glycyl radical protein [Candidatus Coprenecus stercorigallinarum]
MTERINMLREQSVNAEPSLTIERALIETEFYKKNDGRYSIPVMRAKNFYNLCAKKKIYIGDNELIVGERGPKPKAVPTFPELNCHSVEDFKVLRSREIQHYSISDREIEKYKNEVIPYWKGRTQRDRIFNHVPESWKSLYEAGVFTEFMEQRAPGHTALDGKMYHMGMNDFKAKIAAQLAKLDFLNDPEATDKQDELNAMSISCDALILFGHRHAAEARKQIAKIEKALAGGPAFKVTPFSGETQEDAYRRRIKELQDIAEVCTRVPEEAPRTFREAVQMYWFCHLGTILELNGWDAMNPGHFDQHLAPFYEKEIAAGTLTREQAKEYISCFWIKVNNHPAPPKVGITAKESGTYNDFTNINIGGVKRDGTSGESEVSYILLEVLGELHILQPGCSVHVSEKTSDDLLKAACKVIRLGYGYPSLFNPDTYVKELVRQGKSLEDAREGGCSGCIEVGAFGKEAYLLTGYLNVPKLFELALNNGVDPVTGKQISIATGDSREFRTFEDLYAAFLKQLEYVVLEKIKVNNYIDRMFAEYAPATFLSVLIDDCIAKGKDYYNCGPRYNTNYIQCTGLGTVTDAMSSVKKHVFEEGRYTMDQMLKMLKADFKGYEFDRQWIVNHTPFFGNDDDYADSIAVRVYDDLFKAIEGRPNIKGSCYHMNMLSTTCHIYFGKVLGASADGRHATLPISDGTSPSHGADTHGPTAVVKSLGKLDQSLSGGTLLNQRLIPQILKKEEDLNKLGQLIRAYFGLGGHHIQFNIVDTATLRDAQKHPEQYRDLMVRVAGYSDYFNDLCADYQEEIIARTENTAF